MTQDVKNATRYEPDLAYQTLENLFYESRRQDAQPAREELNTVDEVPDGPFLPTAPAASR